MIIDDSQKIPRRFKLANEDAFTKAVRQGKHIVYSNSVFFAVEDSDLYDTHGNKPFQLTLNFGDD